MRLPLIWWSHGFLMYRIKVSEDHFSHVKGEHMYSTDYDNFQNVINYHFNDLNLLKNALTHSSYANEKKINKCKDNERLEFLGDAVLELTSSDYIYKNHEEMHEGNMTKLRASIVCEPTLAMCAREIGLDKYIMLGKGEELTGGRTRDSIISDALEAVIGSIYLDGGFANAKEFVSSFVLNDLDNKKLFFDSKTILQEIVQANFKEVISYHLIGEEGPDHNKIFRVAVHIGEEEYGVGEGRTKKAAEQEAAYISILKLHEKNIK